MSDLDELIDAALTALANAKSAIEYRTVLNVLYNEGWLAGMLDRGQQ